MTTDATDLLRTAGRLSETLATPPPVPCDNDSLRWRGQSLAKGAAGVAVLHGARDKTGHGDRDRVRVWLRAATRTELSAAPSAGLWFGAPAVAFAVAATAPQDCPLAMRTLDTAVGHLVRHRLHAAKARMAAARRPSLSEFDLIRGLTGLGAHLLHREPYGALIRDVLAYLVQLTEPVSAGDTAGLDAPGWWTADTPSGERAHAFPGGHTDLGMAHGISGPLALLALAVRHGVTVPGHIEAVDRIVTWLDRWRQTTAAGAWWPERIGVGELRTGRPRQAGPVRPSWCYGTPGIARAQQLAAIATGNTARQQAAEAALADCLSDPVQLSRVVDPALCHGWAGLAATVWCAAADASSDLLAPHLPRLLTTLREHATATSGLPDGLTEGRAGIALTLHTAATGTATGWMRCLLLA